MLTGGNKSLVEPLLDKHEHNFVNYGETLYIVEKLCTNTSTIYKQTKLSINNIKMFLFF